MGIFTEIDQRQSNRMMGEMAYISIFECEPIAQKGAFKRLFSESGPRDDKCEYGCSAES